MALIARHNIFPVKGKAAREYLLRLRCSPGSEMITLPDRLKMVPLSGRRVVYAVMHNRNEVLRMQHYHLADRYRIVVPLPYQVTFLELAQSYGINTLWNAGIFGSYDVMLQLIGGLAIQSAVAVDVLKRFSGYTRYPYDLETVQFVLAEQTSKEQERETDLVRY